MSVQFIDKIHFFEFGKKPPEHVSRFKDVVNTESLVDFREYLNRSDAKENKYPEENNFFSYVSSRPGATLTYSSIGLLDSKEKIKEMNQELKNGFSKKGNLFWSTVISLPNREAATKFKLLKSSDWDLFMKKIFPKFCKAVNLDFKNMHYFLNMHVNTAHPHIHFVFLEKNQTRTRGKFPQSKINLLNELIAKELMKQVETTKQKEENKTLFQSNDTLKKSIINSIQKHIEMDHNEIMEYLVTNLPQTGRMQLNSWHIKEFKSIILSYAQDLLIHPDIKEYIQKFEKQLKELDNEKSKFSNQNYTSMYDSEMNKLKTQIANRILSEVKQRRLNEKVKQQTYILKCNKKIVYRSFNYDNSRMKIRIPYTKKYVFINKEFIKQTKNNLYEVHILKNKRYNIFNAETLQKEILLGKEIHDMFEVDKNVYDLSKDLKKKKQKINQKYIASHNLIKETKDYCFFRVVGSTTVVQIPKHFVYKANRTYFTIKYPTDYQFRFAAKGGKMVYKATLDKFDDIKEERQQELSKRREKRKIMNSTYDMVLQLMNAKSKHNKKRNAIEQGGMRR